MDNLSKFRNNDLSEFINDTFKNTYVTIQNFNSEYNLLNEIHLIYKIITTELPRNALVDSIYKFSSFFFLRSHSTYLAAIRLALSGQLPEAYMVLRGCLENALYGVYMGRNQELCEIWLKRHKDEDSKKKVRNMFAIKTILQFLKSIDCDCYKIARVLYERTIDYGSHPNPRALFQMMNKENKGESIIFEINYFAMNSETMQLCLKSCAQIGTCSLDIFKNVYNELINSPDINNKLYSVKKWL